MNDLVRRASRYATSAHARINQLRKYTGQPYDVHLKAVAQLVAEVSDDAAMVAAAWLHDVVEDTPATFDEVEREFGADVAQLVRELTDVSRPADGNRAVRKALDRRHLAAASPRAKTIKLADVIDNCRDICRHDARFGRVYLREIGALLPLLEAGDARLHARARKTAEGFARELGVMLADAADAARSAGAPRAAGSAPAGGEGLRQFAGAFAARDVLEALPSFDAGSRPPADCAVAGVRVEGNVAGYLTRDDLRAAALPPMRDFAPSQLAGLDTPLAEVIEILTLHDWCFVRLRGSVIGVIGRADMEKPVVRMWLFGIIILIEMAAVEAIRRRWPGGDWTGLVNPGRLERAAALQAERARRGYAAELLDCLQFADKLQIVFEDAGFVAAAGFDSAAAARRAAKDLESLRNNLAHGQDITRRDWVPIVRLARRVQGGLALPQAPAA